MLKIALPRVSLDIWRVFIFCMAVNETNVALPSLRGEPYVETALTSDYNYSSIGLCVSNGNLPKEGHFHDFRAPQNWESENKTGQVISDSIIG